MDSTCWTLVQGAARGNEDDRESFAWRYSPVIRAYFGARWKQSAHLVPLEDAVQEVFYECFRRGGVLEKAEKGHRGGFRAFLYGLARNVALRHERERGRARERYAEAGDEIEGIASEEEELSRNFDRAWARSVMQEAAALQTRRARASGPEATRRVDLLHLRFYEGLPIREIAKRWSEDPRRVHREYARARDEFREALETITRFYSPEDPTAAKRECEQLLEAIASE